jgi:hypothetical protein
VEVRGAAKLIGVPPAAQPAVLTVGTLLFEPRYRLRNSSGSLTMFAAMRGASSQQSPPNTRGELGASRKSDKSDIFATASTFLISVDCLRVPQNIPFHFQSQNAGVSTSTVGGKGR